MAESVASGVVTPLTSLMLDPLVRQVSYVVKVGEKVKALENIMGELNNVSNDIQSDIRNEVEEAQKQDQTRRRAQLLEGWLDRVPPMANEVSDILTRYEQLGRWCFGRCSGDIITMYKVGKNATKKLEEVTDLYQKLEEAKKSGSLTQAVPSPPGHEMSGTSNLVATERYLRKVLGYLADGVGVVGIFGMGGVGKTTLLKCINNSVLSRGGNLSSNSGSVAAVDNVDEKRLHFDHVIWVTVSRDDAEVQRLQYVIAEQLKLISPNDDKSSWDERSWTSKIMNSLKNKRFVLFLDDVWKGLDLGAMGIPDLGERRAVVFTTRDEAVCGAMEAKRKIKMEVLKPEDAWCLFREKAGNEQIESNTHIQNLARQVAEECGGLPLALITIGRAMSTKKTSDEWRHALDSLKKSNLAAAVPEANPDEKIMGSLKFSYDNLIDEKTQQCLLCCALFPEDYEIPKNELIECLLGHGVIDPHVFCDIGEIYDYGDTLIGRLTSACLLESTQMVLVDFSVIDPEVLIKMHDIIRDMALWIASECKEDSGRWIVRAGLRSQEPLEKIDNWESANRISLMNNDMRTLPKPKEGCPNLSTLMIQGNYSLERIPKIFQHFPSLTYLDMSRTGIEKFPKEVTMLVQLQYLNLSRTRIKSLSLDLKNLAELKYLILRSCHHLKYIPPELISSLPSLQLLDLEETISIVFDLSIIHPIDTKVEELKRLKGRRIKALGLSVKLREFSSLNECVDRTTIWKLLVYGCQSDSCPVRDTLMMGKNIQKLWLNKFDSLQELTMTSDDQDGRFLRLRALAFNNLSRLEKITWKRPATLETFPELTIIWIVGCQLTDISWIRHVTRLKFLSIKYCDEMSNIITSDENGCTPSITFSNLRTIRLNKLPRLRSVYEGTIYCPLLEDLEVRGCEGLTRLPFNFQSHITNKRASLSIRVKSEWWEALKLEDDNIKSQLERFVFKQSGFDNEQQRRDVLTRIMLRRKRDK